MKIKKYIHNHGLDNLICIMHDVQPVIHWCRWNNHRHLGSETIEIISGSFENSKVWLQIVETYRLFVLYYSNLFWMENDIKLKIQRNNVLIARKFRLCYTVDR